MTDALTWFFTNIAMAFYNLGYAISHPGLWLDWLGGLETQEAKQSLMRFIYYGGSVELFFVFFVAFLVLTAVGLWKNAVMWRTVRICEGIGNTVGRFAAWAGLLMSTRASQFSTM